MKQLLSSTIAAPAFFGLNTQESSITLSSGFALEANNCIIDKYGRLGARKGYVYRTVTGGTGTTIRGIHEYTDSAGILNYISWGNGAVYKGLTALTQLTLPAGVIISDNDWDSAMLDGKIYLAQADHPMLSVDDAGIVLEHTTAQYTSVTSVYGRLWAADGYTLRFSDLLNGAFTGGTSGSLDMREIWTDAHDEIINVAGYNGRIIVFCRHHIVILGDDNSSDLSINPVNLYVVDVLNSVGCVARDTVKHVGDDIFFLSYSGLRSLQRVIQEKSNPLSDLSKNVRDELVHAIDTEDLGHLTAIYSPLNAFYLLIFPATGLVYCFDTRVKLEDGSLRVTKWINTAILSGASIHTGKLYLGLANGIGEYSGYRDDTESYFMSYYTNYFDFDQPTTTKILKSVGITLMGGSGQGFTIKVSTDYNDLPRSYNRTVKASVVSEYNVSEFGIAEYAGGGSADRIKVAVGGHGSVIQLGFTADINNNPLSIQKFDVYVKQGRTN